MDIIHYRKKSGAARESFLEHLATIQAKQATIGLDGDYAGQLKKIVEAEIKPAVRTFRNGLKAIDETLVAAAGKGAIGALGGSSVLTLFGDLSWPKVIALGAGASAYLAKALVDAIVAERVAKRECSLSYVLSLDE